MRAETGRRRIGRALVLAGTFGGPLSQWFVFWLLARSTGPQGPGEFATLMAYATPLFVMTGWGLRSTCITVRESYPFTAFLRLRAFGVLMGSGALLTIGVVLGLPVLMVIAVVVMKAADGLTDILYAPMQRSSRLITFGALMMLNGVVTSVAACAIALTRASPSAVVAGSASGSVVTAVVATGVLGRSCPSMPTIPPSSCLTTDLRLVRVSLPVAVAQVAAVLVTSIPTWFVSLTGSSADVGRFAGAAYVLTAGSLLGSSLNSMYIGEFQERASLHGTNALIPRVRTTAVWILACGTLGSVAAYIVGPTLLSSVYGGSFVYSPWFLVLMTGAAVLNPGTHVLNAALLALNRYSAQMWVVLNALVMGVVVTVVCLRCGLPALWSGAVAAVVMSAVKFVLSMRSVGLAGRAR